MVAASDAGVFVIDVTDAANPVVGQTATRPDGTSNAADVVIHERLAYVADGAQRVLGGLRIVDFHDPTNPVVVGSSGNGYGLTSVAFDRGLVLAADYFFVNSVPIFGSDPGTVPLRGLVDFSSYNDDVGEVLTVSASVTVAGARLRGASPAFPSASDITDAGDVVLYPVDEVPDPGTTVTGRVLSSFTDLPVAGARVNVFTSYDVFPALTAADGTFSIPGVPTVDGDLFAAASAAIDGQLLKGFSAGATGEPGGVTDLGTFYLTPGGGGQVLLPWPGPSSSRTSLARIARPLEGPVCRVALGRGSL